MAATYASPAGRCTELISDHAISEPRAPTAPYARLSTPVARYSTTSPTPDRANTPPRARPRTRNGLRSGKRTRLHSGLSTRADTAPGPTAAARLLSEEIPFTSLK